MTQPYRKFFKQFEEPAPITAPPFFMWKNLETTANLPVTPFQFLSQQQAMRDEKSPQPQYNYYPNQQHLPQYSQPQYSHWQFQPSHSFAPLPIKKVAISLKQRENFWQAFKRIYITEVIAFTMSKSTLFTLIFSFMFLGCIFFLSGFFTATNIYREHHAVHEGNRHHTPTETALLQGRPEKMVNMGAGVAYATPRAYHQQGGVKIDRNTRRPSEHVEKQIAVNHPYYR